MHRRNDRSCGLHALVFSIPPGFRFAQPLALTALLALAGGGAILPRLDAQPPPEWNLARTEQIGQQTFYNGRPDGGAYGLPVELGDYDGDGHVDYAIAPMALDSGPKLDRISAGEVHIYRGDGTIGGVLDRASIPPAEIPGLTIMGARAYDMLGTEIHTGDFNGDGIDDLLIGAQNYDGPGLDRPMCGGAFLLLGRPGLLDDGRVVDLLDFSGVAPPPGIVLFIGQRSGDRLGMWVAHGDLDGDGFDDLLLGGDQSRGSNPDLETHEVGMAAVVYGRSNFLPFLDLAEPAALPGISFLYGRDSEDHFGSTIHARDLDGDGRDELIVAAAVSRLSAAQEDLLPPSGPSSVGTGGGKGPDERFENVGEVYIVFSDASEEETARLPALIDFGRASPLPPEIEARVGLIYGAIPNSITGEELMSGDVDGDGAPELLIGALGATTEEGRFGAGAAYVIYGAKDLRGRVLDLADPAPDLPASIAVSVFFGKDRQEILGDTLSVGDFDADGIDDIAIGVPYANPLIEVPGFARIVFGQTEPFPAFVEPDDGTQPGGPTIISIRGADNFDKLAYSMAVADVDGDGHDDLFMNAMHGKGAGNILPKGGEAYLVSGERLVSPGFVRGDTDGDGAIVITDPIATLGFLFLGEEAQCLDGHDTDDSGDVGLTDAVRSLNFLFLGGPPPEPPFPARGLDPTPDDELGC